MATWTATRGTDSLAFNGSPYSLISINGIGGAPTRRLEERGPLQDGMTDLGYRLEPRVIDMIIWIRAASETLLDGYRDTLLEFFKPKSDTPIKLRVTRADGGVRQIDGYSVGVVEAPSTVGERPGGKAQKVGVQLRCANPIWYDPTPGSVAFVTTLSEWRYGGGAIGTANLLTSAENPAQGAVGTIGTPTYWTIVARTARPSSGTQSLFYASSGNGYYFSANSGGTASWGLASFALQGTAYTSGTATLFFHNSIDDRQMHQGTALRFSNGGAGIYFALPNTITWRSNGGAGGIGSAWVNPITHAAVYNIALSAEQRTALRNSIENSTGRYSGTAALSGTWDEYPVITLTGPINDPVITNHTTGEVLDFTGATINANEIYTIDTRYGHKTVTSQTGENKISALSEGSDLATFHLVPGGNFLQVTFTGGTAAATGVAVNYYNRYISP